MKKLKLSISGMSCKSCSSTIESTLQNTPGIHKPSIRINFLTGDASLEFDDNESSADKIKDAITSIGYEVDYIEEINITNESKKRNSSQRIDIDVNEKSKNAKQNNDNNNNDDDIIEGSSANVTTKFLINGMSCASCVNTIEATLSQLPGVTQVNINLLTTEASVKHDQTNIGVRDLMKNVSDIGYQPQLLKANNGDLQFGNRIREKTEKEQKLLMRRFLISLIFAIPTFLVAMIFMLILPESNPVREIFSIQIIPGLEVATLILFLLATPVQIFLGYPFYLKGFKSLYYTHQANMDTLVALGTTVAYLGSLVNVLIPIVRGSGEPGEQFFETSIFLITFIWLGRWMELMAKGKTFETITKLMELQPEKAVLVEITYDQKDNMITEEKEIDLGLVQVGDILKVNPGARIPCDGKIYKGTTTLDESTITGESIPVTRTVGEQVTTATVNLTSMIWMEAERVGNDTTLSRIIKLVQEAQSSKKAPIEELADKIAQVFVPTVISISILDFLIWIILTSSGRVPDDWIPEQGNRVVFSLFFAIAVLVIACPCAMGLASPTAIMVGTGVAAKHGILIKGGGEAIEMAYRLNIIAFDKTGTLTYGKPKVVATKSSYKKSDESRKYKLSVLMEIVRSIESSSDHPLARAVVQRIDEVFNSKEHKKSSNFIEFDSITEVPGKGLEAVVSIRSDNMIINDLLPSSSSSTTDDNSKSNDHDNDDDYVDINDNVNENENNNNNNDNDGGSDDDNKTTNNTNGSKYLAKYKVFIGNEKWMRENNCDYLADMTNEKGESRTLLKWQKSGYSVVLVGISQIVSSKLSQTTNYNCNGHVMVQMGIADTARPDSKKTVEQLKSLGIEIWMITGDNPVTAKAIGSQLGIDNIFSEVSPETKAEKIKWLQRKGATIKSTSTQPKYLSFYYKLLNLFSHHYHNTMSTDTKHSTIIAKKATVAMIGDGINDSPALAQSDLPITMASATDVAIESSSVILTRSTISSVITLLSLSKTIIWRIRLNFLWAYIYNSLAIPIAAGAFFPLFKFSLRPEIASLAMVASSITVVVSSLMLKKYKEPKF